MGRKGGSLLSVLGLTASAVLVLYRLRQVRPGLNRAPLRPAGRPDVGNDAAAPEQIPLPGWRQVIVRTTQKFSENELMSEAASVTFFALLALFPAITALVSIYGLFADPKVIGGYLDSLGSIMPSGGIEIIRDQVQRLTENPASKLGLGAAVGLAAALWSANQGSKAMFSALNVVYAQHEKRSYLRILAVSFAFTLGGIIFLALGLGVIVVLPILFNQFGLGGALNVTVRLGRWPAIVLILTLMLSVLYRFGPSREPPVAWRWVSWGGAFAALAWVALSVGFSWYVAHFGSYNKTYGSLGAIIGFMTWIWLSSTVLLVGAQLNAELESQTARDTTSGS